MTYNDEDEELKILWSLIRFADHNKSFNRKYIDEVYDFYEKHDFITYAQHEVLTKIYYSNNVEEFFDRLEDIHHQKPSF